MRVTELQNPPQHQPKHYARTTTARLLTKLAATASRSAIRLLMLVSLLAWLLSFSAAHAQSATADMTILKSGPATAAADTDVAYSIVLSNLGPDDAQNVAVDDPIPFGMTFVSVLQNSGPAFSCITPSVGLTGTISCQIATLPTGASASFTFTVHIPSGTPSSTSFVNTATVQSSADPNEENNSATWLTSGLTNGDGDLSLTKTGPSEAVPGANLLYTINLTNAGPAAAESVVLIDNLPAETTFVSLAAEPGFACSTPTIGTNDAPVTCSIATLAAGASAAFTITVNVPPATSFGTTLLNTATVGSGQDPNEENNTASVLTTVASTDLSALVTGPATVNAGAPLGYTVTITNLGPDPTVSTTTVSNTLPAGATGASASGTGWGCTPPAGGVIACTYGGSVASGGTFPALNISMTAPADTASVQNSATVSGGADPNPGNNTSAAPTSVVAQANLSITKSSAATAVSGQNIVYTIVVTNGGPSAATGVVVSDPTPAGLSFVSNSGACVTPFPCNLGTLNAGQSATITATFSTSASFSGTVQNTATVAAATADPDNANNSAAAPTNVVQATPQLPIPALSEAGLLIASALLALSALHWRRKRKP